jgi:hypothetical protein
MEAVGERGVFLPMMARLAAATTMPKTIMIDATCLNAHRMGSSLRTKVRWIASASLGQRQLDVWSRDLMVQYSTKDGRMHYGPDSTRERPHDSGSPSSNTR